MKVERLVRSSRSLLKLRGITQLVRTFQPDFSLRDVNEMPIIIKYKYPAFYDPYTAPKPPPSDKIIQLADLIAALPPQQRVGIVRALRDRVRHLKEAV